MVGFSFTAEELAEVRSLLHADLTSDELPDATIQMNVYQGAAADWSAQVLYENVTGTLPIDTWSNLSALFDGSQTAQFRRSVTFRCAGLLAAAVPLLTSESAGRVSQSFVWQDLELKQANLFAQAQQQLTMLRDALPDDIFEDTVDIRKLRVFAAEGAISPSGEFNMRDLTFTPSVQNMFTVVSNLLAAGQNVRISPDASNYRITIESTGGGDGGSFTPSQANLYDAVAAIIGGGTNVTTAEDATAHTITINATDTTFAPTQANIYDAVAAIIGPGANVTVNEDSTAHTITINSTGGGGGGNFTPSKANIYPPVKAILQKANEITLTSNDTNTEVTIGVNLSDYVKSSALFKDSTYWSIEQSDHVDGVGTFRVGPAGSWLDWDNGALTNTQVGTITRLQFNQTQFGSHDYFSDADQSQQTLFESLRTSGGTLYLHNTNNGVPQGNNYIVFTISGGSVASNIYTFTVTQAVQTGSVFNNERFYAFDTDALASQKVYAGAIVDPQVMFSRQIEGSAITQVLVEDDSGEVASVAADKFGLHVRGPETAAKSIGSYQQVASASAVADNKFYLSGTFGTGQFIQIQIPAGETRNDFTTFAKPTTRLRFRSGNNMWIAQVGQVTSYQGVYYIYGGSTVHGTQPTGTATWIVEILGDVVHWEAVSDTTPDSSNRSAVLIPTQNAVYNAVQGVNATFDINSLTAETTANDSDTIAIYDASASAMRKMTRANFLSGVGGGGGNTGDFDLHDDVTTELTTLADADRFVVSDESETGDPNKYVEASALKTYIGTQTLKVSDQTAGTPVATDNLMFSDESETGDPNRKATISTILGLADDFDINDLTAETTAADTDTIAIYDASASAMRKMTRSNFLSGVGGGGGSFDLHDDVTTQLTTLADADRFVVSDESASGDPNRYVQASDLKTYIGNKIEEDDVYTKRSDLYLGSTFFSNYDKDNIKGAVFRLGTSDSWIDFSTLDPSQALTAVRNATRFQINDGQYLSHDPRGRDRRQITSKLSALSSTVYIHILDHHGLPDPNYYIILHVSGVSKTLIPGGDINSSQSYSYTYTVSSADKTGFGLSHYNDLFAISPVRLGHQLVYAQSIVDPEAMFYEEIRRPRIGNVLVESDIIENVVNGDSPRVGNVSIEDFTTTITGPDSPEFSLGTWTLDTTVGGVVVTDEFRIHGSPWNADNPNTDMEIRLITSTHRKNFNKFVRPGTLLRFTSIIDPTNVWTIRCGPIPYLEEVDSGTVLSGQIFPGEVISGTQPSTHNSTWKVEILGQLVHWESVDDTTPDSSNRSATKVPTQNAVYNAVQGVEFDINDLTAETTAADTDTIAIYDASASAMRKMTRARFLSGISGGSFDLHDDVTTELTTLAGADRFVVSDESASGDPNVYIDADDVKTFMDTKVIDQTTGTPTASDYLIFADDSETGDPNKKATISTVLGLVDDFDINDLTAETTAADTDTIAIYDASASAMRKMTRSDFLSGVGGGGSFDLHDDVTTQLTTLADADRFVVSDESETGDPNRYVEASALRTYIGTQTLKVSDQTAGTPVATDNLIFSDESETGDPNRKATISDILALGSGGGAAFSTTELYSAATFSVEANAGWTPADFTGSHEWDDFDALLLTGASYDRDPTFSKVIYKVELENLTEQSATERYYHIDGTAPQKGIAWQPYLSSSRDDYDDIFVVGKSSDKGQILIALHNVSSAITLQDVKIWGLTF